MKSEPAFVINSKTHDLGGFLVQRVLPVATKRMVGPFIFLDHLGPHEFPIGQQMTVRAHPHIGLSTLTYLFSGRIHHRDSLGYSQVIEVGDVNWMTAGKGIAHSERGVEGDELIKHSLHGLQFWVALPDLAEDKDPSFIHYTKTSIPKITTAAYEVDVIVGEWEGQRSPVQASSPTTFLNFKTKSIGAIHGNTNENEWAIYILGGEITVAGKKYLQKQLLVFLPNSEFKINFSLDTHFVLFGGVPFSIEKNIWWNFVSSSKEKIEEAKLNWNKGDFPMVPGEVDRIMAPDI